MAPRMLGEIRDKIASASDREKKKKKKGVLLFAAASGANLRAVANNKGVKINATQIERTGVGEEAQCSQRDVYERVRARTSPALIL